MKFLFIILIFGHLEVNGQRRSRRDHFPIDNNQNGRSFEAFKRQDSLDGIHLDYKFLKSIDDTLPGNVFDVSQSWKHFKTVRYLYDNSGLLVKVCFQDTEFSKYYFYFKGEFLINAGQYARNIMNYQYSFTKYSYTKEVYNFTDSEIEQSIIQDQASKGLFNTLRLGKFFFKRFMALTEK